MLIAPCQLNIVKDPVSLWQYCKASGQNNKITGGQKNSVARCAYS